jgi:hypothetical protein
VRIAGDSGRTQERRGQSEDNRGGQMGRGRTERGYLTGSTILVHRNWGVIKYVNQPGEVCHSLQLQQREGEDRGGQGGGGEDRRRTEGGQREDRGRTEGRQNGDTGGQRGTAEGQETEGYGR